MIVAAMIGGAVWCGFAAVAKIRLRADEVITTLLLNYVGYFFAQDLLYGRWRNPTDQFPVSPTFPAYEQLPTFGGWHLHYGVFIALVVTAFCWWLCRYSRFGLLSQAVAENRTASRALGIPVARITLATACLAGAVSGLAGFSIVCGRGAQAHPVRRQRLYFSLDCRRLSGARQSDRRFHRRSGRWPACTRRETC